MQRHVKNRHETHIREAYDEQHQEGNRRIVLINEGIENDQCKISAQAEFQYRKQSRSPQILLGHPAVRLVLDSIFRGSLETALDSQQRLHDGL